MGRSAYGYQAVAPRDYSPGGVPAPRLPLDSPTLLTRRRYGEAAFQGYILDLASLAPGATGVLRPHREPQKLSPPFPNHVGSDIGTFAGGRIAAAAGPSLEQMPDQVKFPLISARNLLVAIAHRAVIDGASNRGPVPAIPRALNAAQPAFTQRTRRYGLGYQLEYPTAQQSWLTVNQWLAQNQGRLAGGG